MKKNKIIIGAIVIAVISIAIILLVLFAPWSKTTTTDAGQIQASTSNIDSNEESDTGQQVVDVDACEKLAYNISSGKYIHSNEGYKQVQSDAEKLHLVVDDSCKKVFTHYGDGGRYATIIASYNVNTESNKVSDTEYEINIDARRAETLMEVKQNAETAQENGTRNLHDVADNDDKYKVNIQYKLTVDNETNTAELICLTPDWSDVK